MPKQVTDKEGLTLACMCHMSDNTATLTDVYQLLVSQANPLIRKVFPWKEDVRHKGLLEADFNLNTSKPFPRFAILASKVHLYNFTGFFSYFSEITRGPP